MPRKWLSISATITPAQKREVEQKAEASGMSTNEYIKARLFIDKAEEINKVTNLDRWMIKVLSYIATHVAETSNKTLTPEECRSLETKVANLIKRSGFLKDDEIFKNKKKSDEI